MLLWLLIVVFLVFRWSILEQLIGTLRMYLFDAIMFTFLAAINFTQPGTMLWLAYVIGCLCIFWAITSANKHLKLDALMREENAKRKFNTDPTE